MEQDALSGNAIEVRRLHPFCAIGAGMAVTPVVGDDEEDIGAFRLGREGECGEADVTQEIAALHRITRLSIGNAVELGSPVERMPGKMDEAARWWIMTACLY